MEDGESSFFLKEEQFLMERVYVFDLVLSVYLFRFGVMN